MRVRWSVAVVLAVSTCLPGCDMDLDLFDEPLTFPTTPCLEASAWPITGFSEAEKGDGSTALLPRGHSRELFVHAAGGFSVDCDEAIVSVRWLSTRPDVAEVVAEGTAPRFAWLTGRTLGETSVSAELALSDGRTITSWLLVRVVAAPAPSVGPRVLLEGVVDLEPENPTATPTTRAYLVFEVPAPGLLSMHVDWKSASNNVIPHMCPGEAAFPTGCVPMIDGNRFSGQKPLSASTQTSPGVHTLWISNNGPGPETVRYLVGLTPD